MVHDFIQHYFFRPPAFTIIKHEFNLIRVFKNLTPDIIMWDVPIAASKERRTTLTTCIRRYNLQIKVTLPRPYD